MRRPLPALLVTALLAAACAGPGSPAAGFVRVDQVGYAPDEPKLAYLLTGATTGAATFRVVDAAGTSVLSGTAGPTNGAWNDEFQQVRPLDLTALTAPGSYRIMVDGAQPSATFQVAPPADLFGPLVAANVGFFQVQRDAAHHNDAQATVYATPRYDATGAELTDRALAPVGGPVDVAGGWFDAGDFLKFTHTAAYSVAAMLLAQRDSAAAATALTAETGYGLAWLDKMWDATTRTLYAQVGIGAGNDAVHTDHDVWRLPDADETPLADPALAHRPVFRAADPGAPLSPNLAGRVAAAFALSAQLTDGDAARRALDTAAAVYAQADRSHLGELTTVHPHAFYPEASWQDDMEFGAVELALAARRLGDSRAAGWARDAGHWAAAYLGADALGTLGLGDVSALAHTDLVELMDAGVATVEVTRDDLVGDLARQVEGARTTADKDPFGAGASYTDFDAVPHTFGLATTARLYQRVTGKDTYAAFGTQQRNWALGANAWGSSFVIGAGTVTPTCPAHQGANLTGTPLTGAVVNGPTRSAAFAELNRFATMRACATPGFARFDGHGARYVDDVGAWPSVEPADDFTATALLYFALAAG